jgi:hypothetical protein
VRVEEVGEALGLESHVLADELGVVPVLDPGVSEGDRLVADDITVTSRSVAAGLFGSLLRLDARTSWR